VSYCNARPVFIDVDRDTMGLSPEKLDHFLKKSARYSRKTKQIINKLSLRPISAVVPMHTFGNPCRIEDISEVAGKYGLPVVEDAAESLGSSYRGRHTGTFGKIGILSFNGNKIITTGGGGMILSNDEEIGKLAKHLTTQAKVPHQWEFFHDRTGYNYRMPNINAALGLAQIEMLDKFIENKRNTAALYRAFFQSHNIHYYAETEFSRSNYWLNSISLASREERDDFLKFSNMNGVSARPAWTLMNRLPMFSGCQSDDLENATFLGNTIVNLPSSYRKSADNIYK
jgi:dTDP-4-amino-4,6-dideoxygalactose transaminase